MEEKADRYRYKAEKAGRSAARAFLPETGSEAFRKMTKFNRKAENVDAKVRKMAEKLQKKYENVKVSELFNSDKYGVGVYASLVANTSERVGVRSREMEEIRRSNREEKAKNNEFINSISKKDPLDLTDEEHDRLDRYVTTVNELYGHSSDVTDEEYERANRLYEKYIGAYR